ncbi:MAG: S1C family serine protease [Myxococcota bacterium]
MGALLSLLVGVVAAGPPDVLAATDAAQRDLYRRVAPAVVYIVTPNGLGSGMTVSADGLVLTNAHVVGTAESVDVVTFAGERLTGKVVERGQGVDVALVRVDATGLPTVEFADVAGLSVGQWAGAVGHGQGGGWTFTTGMVSNLYTTQGGRSVFQTQIPINPGNSGGPVVDVAGRVIGIVTAGVQDAQNLNFAIRIDVAAQALEGLEDRCGCLVVHAPAGVPVFVDGVAVGVGPRVAVPASAGRHTVFALLGGRKVEQVVTWPETRKVVLTP